MTKEGRHRENAWAKGRRTKEFASFDALAGFVKGDVDPEEARKLVDARRERSRHKAEEERRRTGADEQLAKIVSLAAASGTIGSDFYSKYNKAREGLAVSSVAWPDVSEPEATAEPEGPRFLLKDIKTDSVMSMFDEFVEKEKSRDAKARARRAAQYSPIPMEFHRKELFAKGEFDGDCHDSANKLWHVKTKCSHCGREFEFDTRVMGIRNVKAFCSPQCQYDYCYRTKSGRNKIKKAGTEHAE